MKYFHVFILAFFFNSSLAQEFKKCIQFQFSLDYNDRGVYKNIEGKSITREAIPHLIVNFFIKNCSDTAISIPKLPYFSYEDELGQWYFKLYKKDGKEYYPYFGEKIDFDQNEVFDEKIITIEHGQVAKLRVPYPTLYNLEAGEYKVEAVYRTLLPNNKGYYMQYSTNRCHFTVIK